MTRVSFSSVVFQYAAVSLISLSVRIIGIASALLLMTGCAHNFSESVDLPVTLEKEADSLSEEFKWEMTLYDWKGERSIMLFTGEDSPPVRKKLITDHANQALDNMANNRVREILFFVRSSPESLEGLAATYNLVEMIEIAKAAWEGLDWEADDSRWTRISLPTAEEVAIP